MYRILALFAAVGMVAAPLAATPAFAQNRERARTDEQTSAREHMQAGRNMPIREIERRIIPQMQDDEYLGFEYDPAAQAYRLKFIREGKMIWVDVDARNARVLRVSR
jgi:Ni/Co efflux regulator RcnB